MKLRVLPLSLVSLAAMAAAASAQPTRPVKVERACGVSALPLSVGNSWTYEPVAPPPDRALSEAQMKSTPWPPKKLVITVTKIETADGVTTVTLSEDLDGKAHDTTITCKPGGAMFQASLDAFWFAGEPGQAYGIELSEVQRKGDTLELAAGKLTPTIVEWHDDVLAKWKHVPTAKAMPTFRSGTLDINRHWVLQVPEQVATKAGTWKAAKYGIEINTKVTIEPAPALPLKENPLQVNFFYIVDGVGVVQALNSFGMMYALSEYTVK